MDRTLLREQAGRQPMLDLLFVAVTAGFFALAWAYVRACDRV
jgi:hypothetical protein